MGHGKENGLDANRNVYFSEAKSDVYCHSNTCLDDNFLPFPPLSITMCSIVVFILSLSCFWTTQYGDFFFDDSSAILLNKDIRSETPFTNLFQNDFWGTRLLSNKSHKSYRPFTVLTYRWNYVLGGLHPWGFHAVNIFLYGVGTVFLLRVFSILLGGLQFSNDGKLMFTAPKASLLCACLFAVHPIHTESVCIVVY